MKINQEHYNQLKDKIFQYLDKYPQINIQQGLESMRIRWDIYWNCGGSFSNAQEYQYLNDNHIDTAIKSILKEYVPKFDCTKWEAYTGKYNHLNNLR
jgi:hypothetical protein